MVIIGMCVSSEISTAKEFCKSNNGTYQLNPFKGHFCNHKRLLKQDDGRFIFKPDFSFESWD